MEMAMNRFSTALILVGAMVSFSAGAQNLVVNGDFSQTTRGTNKQVETGNHTWGTSLSGWSSNGYNFVFGSSSSTVVGQYGDLSLWGPSNGANNGLTDSPTGGNFFAADGAFGVAPLQQTINGLTAGQVYNVSFDWAGAQQYGFNGANTEQWAVSLGGETHSTAVYQNTSHGFSGWMHETFSFTATSSSAVLSFLAVGTPAGVPPFSLLDGVSMSAAVPEPGTWTLMLAALGMLGMAARRRQSQQG
jgi:hypothetical protein